MTVLSKKNVRTGEVFLDHFDRGVIETFGGVPNTRGDMYEVTVPGVDAPPPMEGIEFGGTPIYFSFPDETIDKMVLPSFIVRRDDAIPAMSRWHLGNEQYKIAGPGSSTVVITNPRTGDVMATGPTELEIRDQSVPFDLLYTIQIRARYRNNLRVEGLRMVHYAMKKYQPYTTVYVNDSQDEVRSYTAFMESPPPLDAKPDVAGRETGFTMTLRVEAELDLNDPFVQKTLSSLPGINTSVIE